MRNKVWIFFEKNKGRVKNIEVPKKETGEDLVWVVVRSKKEKEGFCGHVILHFS